MNKTSTFMLLAAIAALGACASNEAGMEEDQANDKMTTEQPAAAMPESATQDNAMMTGDSSMESAETTEPAATQAPAPAATSETSAASGGSDNLVSTCTYDGQTRVITVVYDNKDTDTVCEVSYEKSTGVQTLWSAYNERDYCLDKAKEFVAKQEGWGWNCSNLE